MNKYDVSEDYVLVGISLVSDPVDKLCVINWENVEYE